MFSGLALSAVDYLSSSTRTGTAERYRVLKSIRTSAEAAEDAAIPRRRDVHCNEHAPEAPPPKALQQPVANKSSAQWAYERLILYIRNFEAQLDSNHEVAMGFTGGDAGVMRIEGIGFYDPDLVTFYGSDSNGVKTQLVQHVTQLNVMLRALPKPSDRPEPARIGFRLASEIEDDPTQS